MRVLVIDDDEDFRKLALLWFRSCGIEADGAANGAKGLALQRARPAAVIVTDIFMPEMEGIETIHDLRREFPEAKIIAMSGRDPRVKFDVFQVARELGAARNVQETVQVRRPCSRGARTHGRRRRPALIVYCVRRELQHSPGAPTKPHPAPRTRARCLLSSPAMKRSFQYFTLSNGRAPSGGTYFAP